jgi:DNA-binding LacI/PurR family transcriptional regulator
MTRNRTKRVTILEVAQESGVSYQTVSRVINEHPNVAPETRARILDVIKRLNYRPSKAAQSLASKYSSTLAVITYGMEYYGLTQMVVNIERYARKAGYDIVFSNVDLADSDDIDSRIGSMAQWSVDGIILIAPIKNTHYEQAIQQLTSIPFILFDNAPDTKSPSIRINQETGSFATTQHLIELGHQQLVTITGPQNWYGGESRLLGYHRALQSAGLTSVAEIEGDWTAQSGYSAMQNLIQEHTFTGVVAGNDQMALGAIHAMIEAGYRVPQDISIVGFDDIPEASFFLPALTTIKQDFRLLGQRGIQYLIDLIQNPQIIAGRRVIEPQLVIRNSTESPR